MRLSSAKVIANRSSLWSIASTLLRAGGALLTLPIALRVIPQAELGLYYSFLSLSAFALLLDLGFGQTLIRFSAQAWAGAMKFSETGMPPTPKERTPNIQLLRRLVSAARFWYFCVAIIIVLVLTVPGGYFISLKISQGGLPTQLTFCWIGMAVAIGYSFNSELSRTVLFGIGGLTEAHKVSIVAQLASVAVTAVALLCGLGLWSFPLARLAFALVNSETAKRYLRPRVTLERGSMFENKDVIATMWPMAWRQGSVAIGEFLILRAGVITCAALFGLEVTAQYGLTLQVIGVLAAACTAPLAVAMPIISEQRVHGEVRSIVRIFTYRTYIGLLAMLCLGVVAAYVGPWSLDLIGSNTNLLNNRLFLLLLLVQAFNIQQGAWISLVLTENENPFVMPVIFSGLSAVGLSWYLGSLFGIGGMIAGQALIPLVFLNWWSVVRGFKGLNMSLPDFFNSLRK